MPDQNKHQQDETKTLIQYREFFKTFASIQDGKLVMHNEEIALVSDLIFKTIPELTKIVGEHDYQ